MKKALIAIILILLLYSAKSQPYYEWTNIGVGWFQFSDHLTVDSHGNSYFTGDFLGPADFDPGSGTNIINGTGTNAVFISKYDKDGNYIWTRTFGGGGGIHGLSINHDEYDNIYATGQFYGTTDFNPGGPNGQLTAVGGNDFFILKMDTLGNFLWVKSFGGVGSDRGLNVIAKLSHVYICGEFQNTIIFDSNPGGTLTASGNDGFILNLDDQGNYVWVKKIGGSSSAADQSCRFLAVDSQKNVYCSGQYEGTTDFNPNSGTFYMTATSFSDGFVLKLDSMGVFKWAKKYNSTYNAFSGPIDIRNDNNIYVCGNFGGTIDFNQSNPAFQFTTNVGQVVFKMDPLGNINWAKQIISAGGCTSRLTGMVLDSLENIFITGGFCDSINLDPGFSNFTLDNPLTTGSVNSGYIAKFDNTGNFQWGLGQYSSTNLSAWTVGVDLDASGKAYFLSQFYNYALITDLYGDQIITSNTPSSITALIGKIGECPKINSNVSIIQCGSYTSPSQNYIWTTSGNFTDVIPSVTGCDSTININLTILNYGQSSIDTTVCEIYVSPGGQNLASSGTYYDTLVNPPNCDSIIEINLTVDEINTSVNLTDFTLQSQMTADGYQWLNCGDNMTPISGAISQTYSPTVNGNYAVEITFNDCVDTSACVFVNGIGISNSENSFIRIFPNPTNEGFYITGLIESEFSLSIIDIGGKIVFEGTYSNNGNNLIQPFLSSGIYWVTVQSEKSVSRTKLIIQKK